MILESRRIPDVKNREIAARFRPSETFKRIAYLHGIVHGTDRERSRQILLQESAQTNEVWDDSLDRALLGLCRVLNGVGVDCQLPKLRVARIVRPSGTDRLIDSPTSR